MKGKIDFLILDGFNVTDEDFFKQLLVRLPLKYDAIVAKINYSRAPLDVKEIQSLLLKHKVQILQVNPLEFMFA